LPDAALKVLISTPSLDPRVNVSGISSLVGELTRALAGQIEYEYVTLGKPQSGSLLSRRLASVSLIARAMGKLWRSPAPVFHSNTAFDRNSMRRDYPLIVLARMRGKRVLLHVHGGRYVHEEATGWIAWLQRRLLAAADQVIFLSRTEMELFKRRAPAAAEKMQFMYNAVDLTPTEGRAVRSDGNVGLRVAFIGRLVETKGIDVLLAAARASYETPVRFYVHGDGPLRDLLDQASASNPALVQAPLFARSDWAEVLAGYDVLLLPSTSGEGMPMVILEAMAIGVVPVATPIASVPEIISDGERGLLVAPHDATAVIAALTRLASDRALLARLSDASRAYARENFDVRISGRNLLSVYRRLAAYRS